MRAKDEVFVLSLRPSSLFPSATRDQQAFVCFVSFRELDVGGHHSGQRLHRSRFENCGFGAPGLWDSQYFWSSTFFLWH